MEQDLYEKIKQRYIKNYITEEHLVKYIKREQLTYEEARALKKEKKKVMLNES